MKVVPLIFKVDPLEHLGLVGTVCKRYAPYRPPRYGTVPLEHTDEFQDGCMGLLYACAKFDTTRGLQFSTFAWQYIRGYILTGKKQRRLGATTNHNLDESLA